MLPKIKFKLPRRNDEVQIQEVQEASRPKRRKASRVSRSYEETSESDEEYSRPKKKLNTSRSSSRVCVKVDVKMKQPKKKTKVYEHISDSSYEETTDETTESDNDQIKRLKMRKIRKVSAHEKKKGELVVAGKKMVVHENEDDQSIEKGLQTRMSAKHLKNIVENCTIAKKKALDEMGFGNFKFHFNFVSTPTSLGLWILRNFDLEKCALTLSNNRKIKVTRELIHDILGIPMGDIKDRSLKETSTEDQTTERWRQTLPLDIYNPDGAARNKKISITKLENYLSSRSDGDWNFKVGFLVIFFSIFAHGNRDGSVNQRFLPSVEDIENVPNLDWCSYSLECLQKEVKNFKEKSFFAGPLLLLVLIYVNSTISETTIVDRTMPAFKAWDTKLLKKRETEEKKDGFGHLPIVDGLQLIETPKKKLKKKKRKMQQSDEPEEDIIHHLYTPQLQLTDGLYETINRDEDLQQFKAKSSKEMKDYISSILAKSKELIMDTNEKINIALSTYPNDEEINMLLEERNTFYKELYNSTEGDDQFAEEDKGYENSDGEKNVDNEDSDGVNCDQYFNNGDSDEEEGDISGKENKDSNAEKEVDDECAKEVNNECNEDSDESDKEVNNECSKKVDNECSKEVDNDCAKEVDNDCAKEVDNDDCADTVQGIYSMINVSK